MPQLKVRVSGVTEKNCSATTTLCIYSQRVSAHPYCVPPAADEEGLVPGLEFTLLAVAVVAVVAAVAAVAVALAVAVTSPGLPFIAAVGAQPRETHLAREGTVRELESFAFANTYRYAAIFVCGGGWGPEACLRTAHTASKMRHDGSNK